MGAPATASKLWSLAVSLLATAVLIPVVFYLKFGYVDGYAFGTTAFLMLLQTAVVILPKKADELGGASEAAKVPRGRFDFLGVVWLLSIPFAPFFGWLIASFFDVDASNWRVISGIRAFLCVVLPIVSVLPLVRYVRGKPAAFMSTVLLVGTAFPVVTGAGAAYDVLLGPEWQDVRVTSVEGVDFRIGGGTRVQKASVFVHLADGRRLTHAESVAPEVGPARVLVLRGLGRIIATAGSEGPRKP